MSLTPKANQFLASPDGASGPLMVRPIVLGDLPNGTGTVVNINTTAPLTGGPITGTGTLAIPQATNSVDGFLLHTDWGTFNGKQSQLSGTGFVKASGTTITYDNSSYLTAAITSLNGLTGTTQTFTNDTNVTIVSAGTAHVITWSGTLANARLTNSSLTVNGTSISLGASGTVTASAGTLTGTVLASNVVTSSLTSIGTIGTGVWQGTAIADTYISSASTWNAKQSALSGTGFVKISGTTISYDNSSYYTTSNPSNYIALTGLSGTAPVNYANTTGVISMHVADTTHNGYLSTTDWNTFNGKGSGTVTSVSGTISRVTSTSGTTPVLDISATFEALLGKVASPLSQFASTTSSQLAGVISDETGSGALVFATSPSLVTPLLGTPTSGNLANCTFPTLNQNTSGSSASCTGNAATVTTNANLTGPITSSGNATSIASQTGTGQTFVMSAAPTLTGTTITAGLTTTGTFTASGTISMTGNTGNTTANYSTGATLNGNTKTINFGTTGVSGSTTTINVGSSVSGATTTTIVNGLLKLPTICGSTTLVAGTKAITITGLTTSSIAHVTVITPGGTLGTGGYQAPCTSNTLTISSISTAGLLNVLDTSIVGYIVFNF